MRESPQVLFGGRERKVKEMRLQGQIITIIIPSFK